MAMKGICLYCGVTFPIISRFGPIPKYCSPSHRIKFSQAKPEYKERQKLLAREKYVPRPPRTLICSYCETEFEVSGRGSHNIYCSIACGRRAFYEQRKADGRIEQAKMARRARKGGFYYKIPRGARRKLLERDGWVCQLCHSAIDPTLKYPHRDSGVVDHVIPLVRCREFFGDDYIDSPDNWQAAHNHCNAEKGARIIEGAA